LEQEVLVNLQRKVRWFKSRQGVKEQKSQKCFLFPFLEKCTF
jgi:hypothetical protein